MLAELVGCYPIELPMPLDGYDFDLVGVDGMIRAFPKKIKPVPFKIPDQITALDRHAQPPPELAR